MNSMREAPACWMGAILVAACGGATVGEQRGGDGAALRTCTVLAGTYSETFALGAGGNNCLAIPPRTVLIAENEAITGTEKTTAGDGFGLFDAGPGCTEGADSDSCTFTSMCTTNANGVVSQVSISFTFDGAFAAGEESTKATDSTGKVLSSCNYDVTMTKTD
jgi:hypothetical protein